MKLTSRVYRKLKLICGNIARTLNPAHFRRRVSGLVERLVICYIVPIHVKLYYLSVFLLFVGGFLCPIGGILESSILVIIGFSLMIIASIVFFVSLEGRMR